METLQQKIENYIRENYPEYYIMDWKYVPRQEMVELYLDSRKGITISECSLVARELAEVFPELGEYVFIVSSPGLDKPLKLPFQFERNLGKMVSVYDKNSGEEFFGKLTNVAFPNISVLKYKRHKKQIRPTQEEITLEFTDNLVIKIKI